MTANILPKKLSRRSLFGMASAAACGAALPPMFEPSARAQSQSPLPPYLIHNAELLAASVENAFTFQNLMMDAYASGSTIRLAQSYSDAALQATAFTYDNAVAIHAYLASGLADNVARAEVLGAGLLYAQANNFPIADGRFAQAYYVNVPDANGAYITPAAYPYYFYTSAVGDQAWAGMALAQLYERTGNGRYLTGALLVANWIVANTYNTQGAGGYTFGTNINPQNQSVPSPNGKSTEHNIDTAAFFTMLAALTNGGSATNGMTWAALAMHAENFVIAMYQPTLTLTSPYPYFYTGTLGDQVTINTSVIPEDVQTWSYLAGLDYRSVGTIDFARNLGTQDTASSPRSSLTGDQKVQGVGFSTASATTSTADPNAVWLEGTAHLVAALLTRVLLNRSPYLLGDLEVIFTLLQNCAYAQQVLGAGQTVAGRTIPTGLGLVAASSVLDTGFYYTYGPSLHIGATGWYVLAGLAANPFQLAYRVVPSYL